MTKVLLVDDSLTQLEMMKARLTKSGFEVITAKDGYEGYKAVFSVAPDLILSDIIMPNLNGFQLCRLLKNSALTCDVPVILLTVLDKKIDKFWGNKSGANKFISKTAQYEEVEKSISDLVEKYPVSQLYKEEIQKEIKTTEAIQHEVNDIFDGLLMNSTFLSEFRELNKYLRHEEVLIQETFRLLNSFVDYDISGVFLKSPDKNEKNVLNLDINRNSVSKFVIEKIKRDFFSQMSGLDTFSPKDFAHKIINEPEAGEQVVLNAEEYKSVFIHPFYSDEKLCGGICFYKKDEFDYTKCKFYDTLINELLLLLKMRYMYSETEYVSVIDGLTGLYNRRHFESNIEREFLRVRRYHTELSLAMIDIDYFKQVNDTYGHQYGDYVLREICSTIAASFRKTDMIYRYGGEEIVVILPETTMENAYIPLERLREKISDNIFSYNGEETRVTISVGIGCYKDSVLTQHMLVENTDDALYKAKQAGRNKVIMAAYEQSNNNTK